jgi:hypothetical protein
MAVVKPRRPTAAWTRPIAEALDARSAPLPVFFRNDEAGWADSRLLRLIALFEDRGLPIDIAAIPTAISVRLAAQLSYRARVSNLVALHQHGFAHQNHESGLRHCEFGPSRDLVTQLADIKAGRKRLLAFFGPHLEPLFTPPWNRCTAATGEALLHAGIMGVSRDLTAERLSIPGLVECPIAIDWSTRPRHKGGITGWALRCARAIADADGPLGILIHHLITDEEEREQLGTLLTLLGNHDRVRPITMRLAAGILDNAAPAHRLRAIDPPRSALLD